MKIKQGAHSIERFNPSRLAEVQLFVFYTHLLETIDN
jgi:hypothetical protein